MKIVSEESNGLSWVDGRWLLFFLVVKIDWEMRPLLLEFEEMITQRQWRFDRKK